MPQQTPQAQALQALDELIRHRTEVPGTPDIFTLQRIRDRVAADPARAAMVLDTLGIPSVAPAVSAPAVPQAQPPPLEPLTPEELERGHIERRRRAEDRLPPEAPAQAVPVLPPPPAALPPPPAALPPALAAVPGEGGTTRIQDAIKALPWAAPSDGVVPKDWAQIVAGDPDWASTAVRDSFGGLMPQPGGETRRRVQTESGAGTYLEPGAPGAEYPYQEPKRSAQEIAQERYEMRHLPYGVGSAVEYLQEPWKIATSPGPMFQIPAQALAELADPSVADTRVRFVDMPPPEGAIEGILRPLMHSRAVDYRTPEVNPWFNPAYQGHTTRDEPMMGTPEWYAYVDSLGEDPVSFVEKMQVAQTGAGSMEWTKPGEEFPYGAGRRQLATTIQQIGDIPALIDLWILRRIGIPALKGLQKVFGGGDEAVKVAQKLQAAEAVAGPPRAPGEVPDGATTEMVDARLTELFGENAYNLDEVLGAAEAGDEGALGALGAAIDDLQVGTPTPARPTPEVPEVAAVPEPAPPVSPGEEAQAAARAAPEPQPVAAAAAPEPPPVARVEPTAPEAAVEPPVRPVDPRVQADFDAQDDMLHWRDNELLQMQTDRLGDLASGRGSRLGRQDLAAMEKLQQEIDAIETILQRRGLKGLAAAAVPATPQGPPPAVTTPKAPRAARVQALPDVSPEVPEVVPTPARAPKPVDPDDAEAVAAFFREGEGVIDELLDPNMTEVLGESTSLRAGTTADELEQLVRDAGDPRLDADGTIPDGVTDARAVLLELTERHVPGSAPNIAVARKAMDDLAPATPTLQDLGAEVVRGPGPLRVITNVSMVQGQSKAVKLLKRQYLSAFDVGTAEQRAAALRWKRAAKGDEAALREIDAVLARDVEGVGQVPGPKKQAGRIRPVGEMPSSEVQVELRRREAQEGAEGAFADAEGISGAERTTRLGATAAEQVSVPVSEARAPLPGGPRDPRATGSRVRDPLAQQRARPARAGEGEGKITAAFRALVETQVEHARAAANTLTGQAPMYRAEAANTIIADVEGFSAHLAPGGTYGKSANVPKTDKQIEKGIVDAVAILSGMYRRIGIGVIDQVNTIQKIADQIGIGALPKLGAARKAPFVGEPLTGAQQAAFKQKVITGRRLDQPKPATLQRAGVEKHRVIAPARLDPEGWELGRQLAASRVREAGKRAGFSTEMIDGVLDALTGPGAAPKAKSLWTQYHNMAYLHAKAKEGEAILEVVIRRHETAEVPTALLEQFIELQKMFGFLYDNSAADVVRVAGAIISTQRPSRVVTTGKIAGTKFLLDKPRARSGRAAEAKALTELPVGVKGYGIPGVQRRGITRAWAEELPPETLDISKLTADEVLQEEMEQLKAVNALMAAYNSQVGSATTEMMLFMARQLVVPAAGAVGGDIMAQRYAEEAGLTGAARTAVRLAGVGVGVAAATVGPSLLWGGIRGSGLPLPAKVDAFVMNNILSSPRSWLKAWQGAHFGAAWAGYEKAAAGLIDMGAAQLAGDIPGFAKGKENLTNGLGLIKDIATEDLRFFTRSNKSIVRQIYGLDVTNANDIRELSELLKGSDLAEALTLDRTDGRLTNAFIGRVMRSPDWGFQSLMHKRGFSWDEARRFTLTGQLRSKYGRGIHEILTPGYKAGGQAKPLFPAPPQTRGQRLVSGIKGGVEIGKNLMRRVVSPVPRVLLQGAEMGIERTLAPLLKGVESVTGFKAFPESELFQGKRLGVPQGGGPERYAGVPGSVSAARGVGAVGAGAAGWQAQEHLNPGVMPYLLPAMGPMAIPFMLGAGARQAWMTGKSALGGGVAEAIQGGTPLDLRNPVQSLTNLGSYLRMLIPQLGRDVAASFDPVSEGRITSQPGVETALQSGTLDATTPVGALLEQARQRAPWLLGPIAELINASPMVTGLPEQRHGSLDQFGERAFDPIPIPGLGRTLYSEEGGWQTLPSSPGGIQYSRDVPGRLPIEEQIARQKMVAQGEAGVPPRDTVGQGLGDLGRNALTQFFFAPRLRSGPENLTRMDPVLQAMETYGAGALPIGAPSGPQGVGTLRVEDLQGKPITGISRRGQEAMLREGPGETNRRAYEFVKLLMTTPSSTNPDLSLWDSMSESQRVERLQQFRAGKLGIDPQGPLGSPALQRILAENWQKPAAPSIRDVYRPLIERGQ